MTCRFKLGIASWKHPERKRVAYAIEDMGCKIVLVTPCLSTVYKLVTTATKRRFMLNNIYIDDTESDD